MSTIFNIISMHRSQELAEQLRADEEQRIEARAQARIDAIHETCQNIRDRMATQDEYNTWFEQAPEKSFLEYSRAYLADMIALENEAEKTESALIDKWFSDNWELIPEVPYG